MLVSNRTAIVLFLVVISDLLFEYIYSTIYMCVDKTKLDHWYILKDQACKLFGLHYLYTLDFSIRRNRSLEIKQGDINQHCKQKEISLFGKGLICFSWANRMYVFFHFSKQKTIVCYGPIAFRQISGIGKCIFRRKSAIYLHVICLFSRLYSYKGLIYKYLILKYPQKPGYC